MSLLSDAFQPYFAPGLTNIQGRLAPSSLADLIGKQKIVGFDLDFDEADKVIIAGFREPTEVLKSIASDSSRFASAAFQTVQQLSSDMAEKDRIAWSLIQAYYAAFYAGHSILRLMGQSCSYFDRSHISRISGLASALGKEPNFTLKSSSYHCVLSASSTVIKSISLREGKGGAHESFWNVFGVFIKQKSEEILVGTLGEAERQAVFSKIEDFRKNICAENSPLYSYLSIMRNEIQYRHTKNVWQPTILRSADRQQLCRLIGQWKRDPLDVELNFGKSGSLEQFCVTCAFLVSFCADLFSRISARSPSGNNSFARLGALNIID